MSNPINQWASRKTGLLTVGSLQFTNNSITVDDLVKPGARTSAGMALMTMSLWDTSDVTFMCELTSAVLYFHPQRPELSSYPGYFQEPHWQPIGLPEISRVTSQLCETEFSVTITTGSNVTWYFEDSTTLTKEEHMLDFVLPINIPCHTARWGMRWLLRRMWRKLTRLQGTTLYNGRLNSLWPSDAIWRHRSESTLIQVMACCLMAPSHYLNQCWLVISEVQWQSPEGNFTRDTPAINN